MFSFISLSFFERLFLIKSLFYCLIKRAHARRLTAGLPHDSSDGRKCPLNHFKRQVMTCSTFKKKEKLIYFVVFFWPNFILVSSQKVSSCLRLGRKMCFFFVCFFFLPRKKTLSIIYQGSFFVVAYVVIINNQLPPGGISEPTRHVRVPSLPPSSFYAVFGV